MVSISQAQFLANIFLGTITTWNDPAIQALQSPAVAAQLPNTTITTVHRSDGSGTMFAFVDFLSKSSSTWHYRLETKYISKLAIRSSSNSSSQKCWCSRRHFSKDGAIGPLEIAYILENTGQTSLFYGTVQNAAGNFVLANVTNIAAALEAGASAGLPAGNASWTTVSIVDNIYANTTATNSLPNCNIDLRFGISSQSLILTLKVQLSSTSCHGS